METKTRLGVLELKQSALQLAGKLQKSGDCDGAIVAVQTGLELTASQLERTSGENKTGIPSMVFLA